MFLGSFYKIIAAFIKQNWPIPSSRISKTIASKKPKIVNLSLLILIWAVN